MDTKDRIRWSIAEWMAREYEEPVMEAFDSVQGDEFGVAYCQYDDGKIVVDEQWSIDLEQQALYLELNGRVYHKEFYDSLEDMEDALEYGLDFDELVAEADDLVEKNRRDFE